MEELAGLLLVGLYVVLLASPWRKMVKMPPVGRHF